MKSRIKFVKRETPETRYAFQGAVAIHQELNKLGYRSKPSLSTINRVLKRNGLIDQEQQRKSSSETKKYYPDVQAEYPGNIYQLDLVTPRYITGYGRIISVNRIDVYSNQANLDQYSSKGVDSILHFIIEDWKRFGLPRYLQLDNEASFRGSLYHSKTFGKLMRFCLNFGVEIIFIPFNEPWRNAYIESFNSRFNKRLWLFQRFRDLNHLRQESKKFRDKHNHYQVYKKEQFSKQKLLSHTRTFFPKTFSFDLSKELPITEGRVHFVRLINEKGCINILNEDIYVSKDHSFEYVWSTIYTKQKLLKIYYKATKNAPKEMMKSIPYELREPVKRKISVKDFC